MTSNRANSTPQDDADEIRRLLALKIIDGLKEDKPKASFIAAAIKFLSETSSNPAPPPPSPLRAPLPEFKVPFPPAAGGDRPSLGEPGDRAVALEGALRVPFKVGVPENYTRKV